MKVTIYNKCETIHYHNNKSQRVLCALPFHAGPGNKATNLYFDNNLTPLTFPLMQGVKPSTFPTDLKQRSCFLYRKPQMSFLCLPSNWRDKLVCCIQDTHPPILKVSVLLGVCSCFQGAPWIIILCLQKPYWLSLNTAGTTQTPLFTLDLGETHSEHLVAQVTAKMRQSPG